MIGNEHSSAQTPKISCECMKTSQTQNDKTMPAAPKRKRAASKHDDSTPGLTKDIASRISEKESEVKRLAASIQIWVMKKITPDQKERAGSMEFALRSREDDLVRVFRVQELDLKIEYMEKVLAILKE